MTYFYPLLTVIIWSFNTIIVKLSTAVIDPASMSFYRWLVAFLVLTPFVLHKTIASFHFIYQNLWKFAILGILGMCIYPSLAYYAASTTSAAFIGIANGVIPLMTLFLSLFVLKEQTTFGLIGGGILSLIGLMIIISDGNPWSLFQQGIGTGEILLLSASLAYALYGVLIKKWSLSIDRFVSLYVQAFFGLLCLAPFFLLQGHSSLNSENLPLIVFSSIFSSIFATVLWLKSINLLGATKCTVFLNLAPLFTAIFALIFLKESLNQSFIFGGLLILIGVFMAQFLKANFLSSVTFRAKRN